MRALRGVLILAAFIVSACGGAAPTQAPTLAPTAAPTTASTAAPTAVPATATPTPEPATPEPATPEPPTAEPATPEPTEQTVSPESLLISYLHPDIQGTCHLRDSIYEGTMAEVVSITCNEDDIPVDFSLFSSAEAMQAAYNKDLAGAETPPIPNGTCPEGNYEGEYGVDGMVTGRLNCREHTSSTTGAQYHVLEWTNDELLVLGYISNLAEAHDWEDLVLFRAATAGPFPPD